MSITLILSLLVCLFGLLVYALSTNAKVSELGRLAFFAGLFVTLLDVNHIVRLM